jgi:hypothetical protein
MGDADDIMKLVKSATSKWTKQRKAEERNPGARIYRYSRLTSVRGPTQKEIAEQVMEEAYVRASANNTLPATARQVMYQARPKIQGMTDRPLNDQYFCQVLLPDYMRENPDETENWDVTFDARGHFSEPHTDVTIGLGTIEVREYLNAIADPKFVGAQLEPAAIKTLGPRMAFNAVLFIEKEGFLPLFQRAQLAQLYDLAIMSTKGVSVTAARKLVDQMCSEY